MFSCWSSGDDKTLPRQRRKQPKEKNNYKINSALAAVTCGKAYFTVSRYLFAFRHRCFSPVAHWKLQHEQRWQTGRVPSGTGEQHKQEDSHTDVLATPAGKAPCRTDAKERWRHGHASYANMSLTEPRRERRFSHRLWQKNKQTKRLKNNNRKVSSFRAWITRMPASNIWKKYSHLYHHDCYTYTIYSRQDSRTEIQHNSRPISPPYDCTVSSDVFPQRGVFNMWNEIYAYSRIMRSVVRDTG